MSRYYRSFLEESIITPSYTARTTSFATATAITDTTILNALNTFDLGLISNGLDTKMKALYPFVGSTATTQKFNFMDSRDLDVAYRLQFNGGWSFSSAGAKGNGTNTYADTFFKNINLSNYNQACIGIYSRFDENGLYCEGCSIYNIALYPRYTGSAYYQAGTPFIGAVTSNSLGLIVGSSISSSDRRIYKNGTKLVTDLTLNTYSGTSNNIYFGAWNYAPNPYIGNKEYAMSFISEGMTDTDQTNLYTLTQAMQTSLSRQV